MRHSLSCLAIGFALVLQPVSARANLFEEIKARGIVRIATVERFPYFEQKDEQPPRGFIVDLAKQLAELLEVRQEFKVSEPEELLQILKAGEVDLVAGGLPLTPEKALEVTFSPPISRARMSLLFRTRPPKLAAKLPAWTAPDAAIAVVNGSEAADAANAAFPDRRLLRKESVGEVIGALMLGEAPAAVLGQPWSVLLLGRNPGLFAASPEPVLTLVEAFAILPEETRLARFMDDWVAAIEANGFLAERHRYWFEEGGWQTPEHQGDGAEKSARSASNKRMKPCASVKGSPVASGALARC